MLSKNKIKYIHSLETKKARKEENAFIVEGFKSVDEFLPSFHCRLLVATPSYLSSHTQIRADEIIEVTTEELTRASLLKTPQEVLAIFEQPMDELDMDAPTHSLCLALDGVQDPGNMGTIIRVADWFGIEHLYCSQNTVDVYNPKTIQATMGALARVKVHYTDLASFVQSLPNIPVYGTFLNGDIIYQRELSPTGLIIMGNEGNGISHEIEQMVTNRLYIPNYPIGRKTSESLNVAIATSIICAEFRRRFR